MSTFDENITLKDKALYLSKYGHFEGETSTPTIVTRYYTLTNDIGFSVLYYNNSVIQVSKISVDEIKRILACSTLSFDNW